MRTLFVLLIVFLLVAAAFGNTATLLQPNSGRGAIFSRTGSGFSWYTSADGRTDGWQGVHVNGERLWVDWRVKNEGKWLSRNQVQCQVTPRSISFNWPNTSVSIVAIDTSEEFLRVNLTAKSDKDSTFQFRLLFGDRSWQVYTITPDCSGVVFHSPNCSYYVAAVRNKGIWQRIDETMSTPCGLNDYAPAELTILNRIMPTITGKEYPSDPGLIITYAQNPDSALALAEARLTRKDPPDRKDMPKLKMDGAKHKMISAIWFDELRRPLNPTIMASPQYQTQRKMQDALDWSFASLSGFTKAHHTQLWAGYPWFAEAWGRDTFISFFGALLVSGDYETARQILITFAKWIDRNPKSPTFGRVPNRANPREIVFNTADGTAWWVKALYEYGLYSGDTQLWQDMMRNPTPSDTGTHYGALRVVMAGGIARAVKDSSGFQYHGEQETWMDAYSPPVGAWTPRDKYAVEVQALWIAQLQAAISIAEEMPATDTLMANVKRWRGTYQQLMRRFPKTFLRTDRPLLYDRIKPDGSFDSSVRPNQFFAFTVPYYPLFPDSIAEPIVKAAFEELVTPYGVMSLSPRDTNFHPYHMHAAYPKDAAYHTGVVWTWLSGSVKTLLCRYGQWERARELQSNEAELILQRSQVVGTLPELLDAAPRDTAPKIGNSNLVWPRQSGTVSQTWSLAEFTQVFHQDFMGIRPIQANEGRIVWQIDPQLDPDWGRIRTTVNMQGHWVDIAMQQVGDTTFLELKASTVSDTAAIHFELFASPGVHGSLNEANQTVHFAYSRKTGEVNINGQPAAKTRPHPAPNALWKFATVKFDPKKLPALKPPSWPRVGSREGTLWNDKATVLFTATDESNDELKQGYSYPSDSRFAPGIFDLTNATISSDNDRVYFSIKCRTLSQPGWHPEYGYQLTFTAIAISTGKSKGASKLGMNALTEFGKDFRPDRILYIGGGFRLTDTSDATLIECVADDAAYPLGSPVSNEIRVSVPRKLLPGKPEKWKIRIYCGGQDDHGGAGMGEFRSVNPERSQWQGGGNTTGGTNIYDEMIVH